MLQLRLTNRDLKFDFAILPCHILFEIISLLKPKYQFRLLFLNREIFNTIVPICYHTCTIQLTKECHINLSKYGKYIKQLSLTLPIYDEILSDLFMSNIQNYLNPCCQINLKLISEINLKHLTILNKFVIKQIQFDDPVLGGFQNYRSLSKNLKKLNFLRNATSIICSIRGVAEDIELLKLFPLNLKILGISDYWNNVQIKADYLSRFNNLTHLNIQASGNMLAPKKLLGISHPNLEVLNIGLKGTSIDTNTFQINGDNFPELKNLSLCLNFRIDFINTFQKLESFVFEAWEDRNIQIHSNFPICKNIKLLKLNRLLNGCEITTIYDLGKKCPLREDSFSFLNLTNLNVCVIDLDLTFFRALLKPIRLKILLLIWDKIVSDLKTWLEAESPKMVLSLEYINVKGSVDQYKPIIEFLLQSSPHLIKLVGDSWTEDIIKSFNQPSQEINC